MSLLEIAKKYPTSKNDHGFIEIYHKYFSNLKEHKINILEIGVERGDSLRMWREYFTNATICAIDLHDRNISVSNTEILIGDQSDYSFLETLVSSQSIYSDCFKTSTALNVISPKFPIGVETTYKPSFNLLIFMSVCGIIKV